MNELRPLTGTTVVESTSSLGALTGAVYAALGARVLRAGDARDLPAELVRGKAAVTAADLEPSLRAADFVITDEMAPPLDRSAARAIGIHLRGYPEGSSRASAPYTDLALAAASGELPLNGFPDRPPYYPAGDQAYRIASLVAAAAGLASLYAKRQGGRARDVDVAAQEAMALSTVEQASVNQWPWHGQTAVRLGADTRGHGGLVQAADGKWVVLNINEGRRILRWFEDEGLGGPFAADWDDPENWVARYDEMLAMLDVLVKRYDADALVRKAQAYRLLAMPVATVADVLANEQLAYRGFFEHEGGSSFPGLPWKVRALERAGASPGPRRLLEHPERPAKGGPLSGLRILEFCGGIAGPTTTRFFANLGAEVIKIESDAPPDILRTTGLQPPGSTSLNTNSVFNDCNTGKFSITLNLRNPEAIDLVKRLIAVSDAIVTSFTPGVLEKFGLGFEDAAAVNPSIIYYASSVYGREGPFAGYRSYGWGICAAAGLNLVMGEADQPPVGMGNYHSDFTGPYFSAVAILAALLERDRDPRARLIDFSQVEGAVWLLGPALQEYEATGKLPVQDGNRSPGMVPHGLFRCTGEDEWCAVAARDDDDWRQLCAATGLADLAAKYPTLPERRAAINDIEARLGGWFASREKWAAASILVAAGVPASPVENNRDLYEVDEGMRAVYTDIQHPEGPVCRVMREPFRLDGERPEAVRAPLLGEHTGFVLQGLLGLAESDVDLLYATEVII